MTCPFMFFVTLLREVTFARVYKEKNFFLWYTAHLFVTLHEFYNDISLNIHYEHLL